jgi:hypothetical protein
MTVSDSTYKLGTYETKAEAISAVNGAITTASAVCSGSVKGDWTLGSRGWVATVSGSTKDIEALKRAL